MDAVTLALATELGQEYTDHQVNVQDEDYVVETTLPTLKGGINWISYRDAFILKLQGMESTRGFSLSYLIDETPRPATRANVAYIEADILDFNDEDLFVRRAVHFGNAYKTDNKKLWSLLEGNLVNTDPFNHIAEYSNRKDGRAAWKALKSHYEGEDYIQKIRSNAMDKLSKTFYRGDTKHFKFEDYVNVHIKAHKHLLDIDYNNGHGMDDATKILHFKAGILPQADLETAITLARTLEARPFRDYTTFLSTEVDSKNFRRKQTAQPERRVSRVQKEKKKGKVESKNYPQAKFSALTKNQRTAVIRLNRERYRRATQASENKKNAATHNVSDLKRSSRRIS